MSDRLFTVFSAVGNQNTTLWAGMIGLLGLGNFGDHKKVVGGQVNARTRKSDRLGGGYGAYG